MKTYRKSTNGNSGMALLTTMLLLVLLSSLLAGFFVLVTTGRPAAYRWSETGNTGILRCGSRTGKNDRGPWHAVR